jgi:hypothetical protein
MLNLLLDMELSRLNRRYIVAGAGVIIVLAVFVLMTSQSPVPDELEPPYLVPEFNLYYGVDEVSDGEQVTTPSAYVSDSSESFFILQNAGNQTLNITNLSLESADSAVFNIESFTGALEPGSAKLIKVSFTPSDLGSKSVFLHVQCDDPDEPETSIQLTGEAESVKAPEWIMATPDTHSVELTWSPVEYATGYNIHWGTEDVNENLITDASSPYTLNLTAGQLYYFTVSAVNQYGESSLPDPIWAHPDTTFYLDSVNGDDSNNGTSPQQAWKSLERVRAQVFEPGDNLLLKRDCTWYGPLEIDYNGTTEHPITVAAYGEGVDPIITERGQLPDWRNETKWTSHGYNIWSIYYGPWRIAMRLWIDGVERVKAQYPVNLSEAYPWIWDTEAEELYIYSLDNPSKTFTSLEECGVYSGSALNVRNVDYHSYRSLQLEGGGTAVSLTGSNHVEFIKCDIGRDTGSIGVWISGSYLENRVKPSDYGLIRWCRVDPWFRLSYPFEKAQTEDGIHMRDNVNHWTITDSVIRDWGHTGIDMWQTREDTTVNNNTINNNIFTSAHVSYGRAFSTKGRPSGCSYNQFTGNTVANCSVQVQIGGDHNQIKDSIFYGQWTTPINKESEGQTIVFNQAMSGNPVYVSSNNLLEHNVVYNSTGTGIDDQQYCNDGGIGNKIRGNILIKTGYLKHHKFLGVGIKIGNYVEEWFQVTCRGSEITDNIVLNPDSNYTYWYRGTPFNATAFNGYENPYGDTITGNRQITATETELILSEKMLRFLLME